MKYTIKAPSQLNASINLPASKVSATERSSSVRWQEATSSPTT